MLMHYFVSLFRTARPTNYHRLELRSPSTLTNSFNWLHVNMQPGTIAECVKIAKHYIYLTLVFFNLFIKYILNVYE